MLINISDNWPIAAKERHREYITKIINATRCKITSPEINYFLHNYGEEIALASANRLLVILRDMEHRLSSLTDAERETFHADCRIVFDYKDFSRKSKKGWNAYQLCSTSIYKFCPYCQLTDIDTIIAKSSTQALRFPLDHFYSKDLYPYLAMALYNLVPSCHSCNSSLKSTKDFAKQPHLHPYASIESICHRLDVEDYISYLEGIDQVEPPTIVICSPSPKSGVFRETRNSIDTFLIKERLEKHQQEVSDLIVRLRCYQPERIPALEQALGIGFLKHSERMLLAFSRENYKNEKLGVAKKDMYDLLWKR